MNTRGLLDQLLKSGQDLLQNNASGGAGGGLAGSLGGVLGSVLGGSGKSAGDLGALLKSPAGKALAVSALGVLLGNKSASKVGSKALTYGGLAALGVVAYKAFNNWQAQQAGVQPLTPQTVDRVSPELAEEHSQAILRALVGAAKADGHVDERERALIEGEFSRLAGDSELQRWLQAEVNKPLDPADIARAASTPEMAAEMYIASVLMVDEEHYMERAYLDELARQLKIDPALKVELEKQVREELTAA